MQLSPELIRNGDFAAEAAWTMGTNWTYLTGEAAFNGSETGDVSQPINIIEGHTYRVVYTIVSISSCSVTPYIGGVAGTARTSTGTYTEDITATGKTDNLAKFRGATTNGAGTISIDDVSVKEVYSCLLAKQV